MYREDQEALEQRASAAAREAERLRRENEAMRAAMGAQAAAYPYGQPYGYGQPSSLSIAPSILYAPNFDVRNLPVQERARLSYHQLSRFPVWAMAVLNIVTLGLFPLIHFSLMHDKLPRAAADDPSGGKALGFSFIPYFNIFYWLFFNSLRLCSRLTLQFKLRGLPDRAPRAMVLTATIFGAIPYVNLLIGIPIMWTIAAPMLQASVNRIAALPPTQWDGTP